MLLIYFTYFSSGSSAGDMGDLTPCNASPNLSGIIGDRFQPITRDDAEEVWSLQILSLFSHVPSSPLQLFHLLHRVIKVCIVYFILFYSAKWMFCLLIYCSTFLFF